MKNLHHKKSCKQVRSVNRKAQIEISFNWIFVIIAGAVILLFFVLATKHEKQSVTEQTAKEISGQLESLLSAIQQNPDAVQTQDVLSTELEFHCQEDGHTYSIKDSNTRETLDSQIIFAPEIVGGTKTIAWTKLYSSPYPVAYSLYFTDDKTKYIFIDSQTASNAAKDYYLLMPDLIEKELMTKEQIDSFGDQGFRRYIIVANSADAGSIELQNNMKDKSTILGISTTAKAISFRQGDEMTSESTFYSTEEAALGAIISGDIELYGCTMEKLMQAARIAGEINLKRAELLEEEVSTKCQLFFASNIPQDDIQLIIDNSYYAEEGNYNDLETAMTALESINKQMARANCPTIY